MKTLLIIAIVLLSLLLIVVLWNRILKLIRKHSKPRTSSLHKTAHSYNRKKFKKDVRTVIRNINGEVKHAARQGKTHLSGTIREEQSYSWEKMLAYRWYRRYSGLECKIDETVSVVHDHRYVEEMYMNVKW